MFSLAFLIGGVFYCRVAKFSFFTTILFLIIIFTVFGEIPSTYHWLDQVWIWPMNSYGVYDLFSLICCTLVFKLLEGGYKDINKDCRFNINQNTLLALTSVIFFLFSLNGTRGFLVICGGVLFSIYFEVLMKRSPWERVNHKEWIVALILTLSSFLGLLIISFLTKDIPQQWQDPYKLATLTDFNQFRDRLISIPYTWFILFNALPTAGQSLFSFLNISHIFNTIFSSLLIGIPLFRITCRHSQMSLNERLMISRLLFLLLMIIVASLYGDSSRTARYLLPLAYGAIFILPFYVDGWLKEKRYGLIAMVLILLTPTYLASIKALTSYSSEEYTANQSYKFAKYLEGQGLQFGFAGPWQSNVLTVNQFSDGKVRVAIIDPDGGKLQPHRHGDKEWYEPKHHIGKTFLALPENIYINNAKAQELHSKAIKTLNYDGWVIDVFEHNICIDLDNKF